MANPVLRPLLSLSSLLYRRISFRQIHRKQEPLFSLLRHPFQLHHQDPWSSQQWQQWRSITHGSVNVVISSQGKAMFETHETDPPKKDKFMNKKRFKLQKMKEKKIRKTANKTDPRRLGAKGDKKRKFATADERIKYKLQQARNKEALLIERLKKYEVPRAQGPMMKPQVLTGEERFYMKKMAQKRSNYVQVGRRGVYGGVILNMHMHWKRHETVEVICKPCKPGEVHEYADEIAKLSGGIPIQVIGDDTIIFYRGKNYEQPKVMSPIDTLSKKRALEKSKYEQSLESVRHFIAIAEKELELYYRHVALYGDPKAKNSVNKAIPLTAKESLKCFSSSSAVAAAAAGVDDQELSEDEESSHYSDYEGGGMLSEDMASSSDENAEEKS